MTKQDNRAANRALNRTVFPTPWVIRGKLRAIGNIHRLADGDVRAFDEFIYRCECGNHIRANPQTLIKKTKSQSKVPVESRVHISDVCCGAIKKPGEGHRGECRPATRPYTPEEYAAAGFVFEPFPPYADEE